MMILIIFNFVALLVSIIVHEVAHGAAAYKLGDKTAYLQGRLSFNPFKHLDLLGSLIVPLLFYVSNLPILGWAKPVPVSISNLKKPSKDMCLIALAGPVSNLVLLCFFALFIEMFLVNFYSNYQPFMLYFSLSMVQINIVLTLFNLIPIPPLDGSKVLHFFMPSTIRSFLHSIEPYGFIILFVFLYFGLLDKIILPLFNFFMKMALPSIDLLGFFDTSFYPFLSFNHVGNIVC